MSISPTKILIPARLESIRLPNKPLLHIGDKPMILHVLDRAREADIGDVAIATDSQEILDCVRDYGGEAIMTSSVHQSGSDRIWEAAQKLGVGSDDIVINLQGDLPTISPETIRSGLSPLVDKSVDFATLAAPITDITEAKDENVVKLVGSEVSTNIVRPLYFSRSCIPWSDESTTVRYHHIGLYAWRCSSLGKFVSLPPSPLECIERLEQLRALEAGMVCHACIVDTVPLGVDTQLDLDAARKLLK